MADQMRPRTAEECFWKQAEPYMVKEIESVKTELRCLRKALDALKDEVDDLRLELGRAQVKLAILVGAAAMVVTSLANIAAAFVLARHFNVGG